jgi:Tol biopolymer transport system component
MVLVRVDLPSGSIRDLSGPDWTIGQPAWSSDGTTIFAPANAIDGAPIMQIWAFDARTGAHRALTSSWTRYDEQSLSATANDEIIANSSAEETNLWVTDQSGQPSPLPALRGEGSFAVVWVDDRIVTSTGTEMVVHDQPGQNPTKLRTYSTSYAQLARCGPGNVVYWASDKKRGSHIARTDITTGASSALTDGPNDTQPACTADGSTLVFAHCSGKGDHCALTRKSLDSGKSLELYQFDPADNNISGDPSPSVSPDGKSVLFWRYTPAEDSYEWAAIIPLSGGEVKKIRMPVPASQFVGQGAWGAFRWAADSNSIFYARNEKGSGNVWWVPLAGGAPTKITNFDTDQIIFAFDVSPQNRLVISRGNWISDVVLIKKVKE